MILMDQSGVVYEDCDYDYGAWYCFLDEVRFAELDAIIARRKEILAIPPDQRTKDEVKECAALKRKIPWDSRENPAYRALKPIVWPFEDGKRYRITVEEIT